MDIGTISLILLVGLMLLLAIGMPLGLASAVMAVVVLVMKFEPTLLLDPTTFGDGLFCLLYTSPSPRDATLSRMPSSA